ncbi:MAG: sodium:calcium antiporter [Actinomycetota bacterium]
MLVAVGLLVVGAVVLYAGAEAAVRGAAGLARVAGIPAFLVGALLFGVDFEGVGAAVIAAGRGQTAVAAGSIFGTVLFLFSAAFGAALLFARRPLESPPAPMVLAPAAPLLGAALVIADRFVSRAEAVLVLVLYGAYVAFIIREGWVSDALSEEPRGRRTKFVLAFRTVLGLVWLSAGAYLLVSGGVRLLERTTLAAGFIGAAVVGTLASLDEVVLEVLPIRRGIPDLATGNLFGTLAAFSSGVLGIAALVRPLVLDSGAGLAFLAMAFLYAIVAGIFLMRGRAGPMLGAFVLACYGAWLVLASSV